MMGGISAYPQETGWLTLTLGRKRLFAIAHRQLAPTYTPRTRTKRATELLQSRYPGSNSQEKRECYIPRTITVYPLYPIIGRIYSGLIGALKLCTIHAFLRCTYLPCTDAKPVSRGGPGGAGADRRWGAKPYTNSTTNYSSETTNNDRSTLLENKGHFFVTLVLNTVYAFRQCAYIYIVSYRRSLLDLDPCRGIDCFDINGVPPSNESFQRND